MFPKPKPGNANCQFPSLASGRCSLSHRVIKMLCEMMSLQERCHLSHSSIYNLHEISLVTVLSKTFWEPPLCATHKDHLTLKPPGSGVQRRICSSCMSSEALASSLPRRATLTACNSTRPHGMLGFSEKASKASKFRGDFAMPEIYRLIEMMK